MPPSARHLAMFVALATALLGADHAAAEDDFYKGKQIRLIVSTDAGGAYDTYGRMIAQVMKDHIPGNPTIIVQNMPGASGVKTANYMANQAPRDGTVIAGVHSSIPAAPLITPGATNFDSRKFSWIGSATSDPYVGYVWHTAPIKTLDDALTTEVIMGGIGVGSAGTDMAIICKDMFGFKFKIVSGYKASNDVKLAMERGEVEGTFANAWSSLKTAAPDWIADKKIRIIVQHGFKKHPDLPDVPLIFDYARSEADRQALVFMLAKQEAAKPYFAPPGIPPERLAILRRAFDETVRDPKFLALAQKAGATAENPMTGDELAALIARVSNTPAEVVHRINRMLADPKK